MRRTDVVRRETLDYTEFYWWHIQQKLDGQDEAMRNKDQAEKEKK